MELSIITIIAATDIRSLETTYTIIVNGHEAEHYCSGFPETLPPVMYYDFMETAAKETIQSFDDADDKPEIVVYYGSQLRELP